MEMKEAIKNFNQQFEYEPEIENARQSRHFNKFIVVGMGGSRLAADLLKVWNPYLDVVIHKDYGLPALSDQDLKERFVILSSYSGNTEEVIDAFNKAIEKNWLALLCLLAENLLNWQRNTISRILNCPIPEFKLV